MCIALVSPVIYIDISNYCIYNTINVREKCSISIIKSYVYNDICQMKYSYGLKVRLFRFKNKMIIKTVIIIIQTVIIFL
jgi:hypothetical protein